MKRIVILCCILSAGLAWMGARAQVSVNMGTQTSVTGCDIDIYDDGGPNGTYGPSHNYTLTLYPEANQGRVAVEILSLDIHQDDTLYIYDGASTSAAQLAALNNSNFSISMTNTLFMASQGNPTGALTLRFKVSLFSTLFGNNHGAGFAIHATCSPTCMPFQIALDTANCSHLPVLNPTDQYLYLDLCPNEAVQLAVKGIYPSGGTGGYMQSDATTHFSWHLENNAIQNGTGLTSVTHTFTPGNGCEVNITATDTLFCPVQMPVTFRVRTSDNPIQGVFSLPQLCVGQTFTPAVGTSPSSNILLNSVGYVQPASLAVNDTVFLPDGENCPPYGLYYRSNVTFTEFAPNATLTSANDILFVRIKMEHSAIEDVKIEIFCPNGNSSTILPYPNFESTYDDSNYPPTPYYFRVNMGSAYRPDGGTCNASLNPIGEPWNYIWSNNTTLGYQYASSNGNFFNSSNFHGHYNPHWDTQLYPYYDTLHSYSVDSSNIANMSQIYHPYQNFNSLVGCPLNGNWYIQVQDMLPYDNGYIVEWELALNPSLLPSVWGYEMDIDTFFFTGSSVVNGGTILPESAGNQPYSMTLIDNFGCQYETSFAITVFPQPDVSLGDDRKICQGETVSLSPASPNSAYGYHWNTGATTSQITVSQPGTYTLTANVSSNGSVLCQSSDTVEVILMPTSETSLSDAICAGNDYSANGFAISATALEDLDTYTETRTLTNQYGCDSVVTLELTVLPRYDLSVSTFACEQYDWEGETYTESGDYTKSYTSADGCDSTVTLHLSIGYPAEEEVWETVCGQYVWAGETITESGDYTKHFASQHECDSMVTLHLTVIDTFLRAYVSNPDFCTTHETELAVEGNFDDYLWNTGEVGTHIFVTTSGLYTLTASNIACQQVERFEVPYCPLNILLPNTITPSKNDGLNDILALSEYDKIQIGDFSIALYDRWGELVFWSNDKDFRWDGRKDGQLSVNATYNYLIRCTDRNGKAYVYRGSVTVL